MKPTANMPSAAVTAAARKLVVATLTYRTRLVWRGDGMIGVAFVPPNAEPIRANDELQRLERENTELRKQATRINRTAAGTRADAHNYGLGQLNHLTVAEGDTAVHPGGQVHIMRGNQRPQSRRADKRHHRIEDVPGRVRVEVAGRLIGKQDARRIGDRPSNRDPLLLATGQFRRTVGAAGQKPEVIEELAGPALRLGAAKPADHLR
jgi:hypothetical protein